MTRQNTETQKTKVAEPNLYQHSSDLSPGNTVDNQSKSSFEFSFPPYDVVLFYDPEYVGFRKYHQNGITSKFHRLLTESDRLSILRCCSGVTHENTSIFCVNIRNKKFFFRNGKVYYLGIDLEVNLCRCVYFHFEGEFAKVISRPETLKIRNFDLNDLFDCKDFVSICTSVVPHDKVFYGHFQILDDCEKYIIWSFFENTEKLKELKKIFGNRQKLSVFRLYDKNKNLFSQVYRDFVDFLKTISRRSKTFHLSDDVIKYHIAPFMDEFQIFKLFDEDCLLVVESFIKKKMKLLYHFKNYFYEEYNRERRYLISTEGIWVGRTSMEAALKRILRELENIEVKIEKNEIFDDLRKRFKNVRKELNFLHCKVMWVNKEWEKRFKRDRMGYPFSHFVIDIPGEIIANKEFKDLRKVKRKLSKCVKISRPHKHFRKYKRFYRRRRRRKF